VAAKLVTESKEIKQVQ